MAYVFMLLLMLILWLAFRNKKNGPIRNRNNDWPVSDSGNSFVSRGYNNDSTDTGSTEFGGGECSGGGADGSWDDGGSSGDSGDSGGDGGGDGGGD